MKSIFLSYKWLILGIICLALSPLLRTKFDLSEEKKFSISTGTKSILDSLKAPIKVKVFLDDENTPGGFKRLHEAIISTLNEFKDYSSQQIEVEQVHIYKDYPTERDRNELAFYLDSLGLPPTNVVNTEDGKKTQIMVFPGIVIEFNQQVVASLLLKGNKLSNPQEILNQSMEGLEFEIIQAIRQLQNPVRKKVGFLLDYSATPAIQQWDLIRNLKKKYDLYPVDLDNSMTLDGLDAICLIQPNKPIPSQNVFKIDQFLVKGGKALFFMDGCRVDTVQNQGLIITPTKTGLEELFFKNGFRINADLVKDAQLCAAIPLVVGNYGDKPNIQLMPWPAFPLLTGNNQNNITRNLDNIYGKFVSSIDTLGNTQLKITPLLHSGKFTQLQKAPATLPFSASGKEFEPSNFKSGEKISAIISEGIFNSIFANRILPNDSLQSIFVEKGNKKAGILLVADGDIPLNSLDPKTNQPLPLGFDVFSQHTFGNKDFILNAFSYLLDDQNALMARSKKIILRPLDKEKIAAEKSFWKTLNLSVPIIFGLFMGFGILFWRKRKYQQ
ncbi:gliding motility-associated ABC transporter substrate-binding protein GldG [Sandaracinomonas limnophila]|uniref:Gliding motility-associated ABC transporter substrate-binding protein GldG n=1 Tax=Sandaracinomonas limnophila TaxID=1862386 RepID=A0A437PMC8_9BACT|nr:gliding motility-associated ABC transporter substrate-binding protein GldG [Sandaracinomonas limnophila]RVU23441.1 gliding motility-associated ABC transporter substrate-binding protein GldG [Sandaracinomonas limnophila]